MEHATSRRAFLASTAAGTSLLAGCGSNLPVKTPTDDGPVVTAPIPNPAGQHAYATMGSNDASLTVDYYGNWKCPYCAQFSTGGLGDLVTEYVEPGAVKLRYRSLTYVRNKQGKWVPFLGKDIVRASQVGLGVWNHDPQAYWRYHETVMKSQGPERKQWASFGNLKRLTEAAGVENWSAIKNDAENEVYRDPILQTSKDAAKAGIAGTPTINIDGTVVNALKQETVFDVIDSKLK